MKNIFIFAYYSYKDPVFQSAVLPYFIDFPDKRNFLFILLTFEQKKYRTCTEEKKNIKKFLRNHNIVWYNLNWHSGRFKLFKKVYDLVLGFFVSAFIIKRFKVDIIYAEAFPGSIITHILSNLFKKPHVIHSFEPHTEYMVEGGVWHKNSWESRVLNYYEKAIARKASAIMTATGAMIEKLKEQGVKADLLRVPSCVDLNHFNFSHNAREAIRKVLKINEDECVVVCIGKMGGMYWEEEIFSFFRICLQVDSRFRFLFFTPDDTEKVKRYINQNSIPSHKISIGFLKRDEVPKYLSAADFGLVPVHQYPSKRFCSPIKDGEYWACGLPIVIPVGVSDDYMYAMENSIGVVLENLSEISFKNAAEQMISLWDSKVAFSDMRRRCIDFVSQDRNVFHYKKIYKELFEKI